MGIDGNSGAFKLLVFKTSPKTYFTSRQINSKFTTRRFSYIYFDSYQVAFAFADWNKEKIYRQFFCFVHG